MMVDGKYMFPWIGQLPNPVSLNGFHGLIQGHNRECGMYRLNGICKNCGEYFERETKDNPFQIGRAHV